MAISDIGKHCIWADRQVVTLLRSVLPEDFSKKLDQTGRGLQDLVVHLLSGYDMVLGNDYNKSMEKFNNMKQKELLDYWDKLVEQFIKAIEENPAKSFEVKVDDGSKKVIKGQNYLLAYTDHSTYHRGQLITTFKIITGKEAVSTDFYTYLEKSNPL